MVCRPRSVIIHLEGHAHDECRMHVHLALMNNSCRMVGITEAQPWLMAAEGHVALQCLASSVRDVQGIASLGRSACVCLGEG